MDYITAPIQESKTENNNLIYYYSKCNHKFHYKCHIHMRELNLKYKLKKKNQCPQCENVINLSKSFRKLKRANKRSKRNNQNN